MLAAILFGLLTAQVHDSLTVAPPKPIPGCKGAIRVGKSIFVAAGDPAIGQANLACYRSDNHGETWEKLGSIVRDPIEGADLGDGNMLRLPNGHLLVVYRRNHYRGNYHASPEYGIHVSESSDGGATWQLHSMVAQHRINRETASRGYWAPFIFRTRSGRLQCYYDDEYTPFEAGFQGHQWVEMKTFDAAAGKWGDETTVSRAPDPKGLSRDGMATVVETNPGKLLCVLESVSTHAPVVGNVRSVTSSDDGQTWSWRDGRRPVVYEAPIPYHAFSPWLVQDGKGAILCLFATDEGNGTPMPAGTPADRLKLDIKLLVSSDAGGTWSKLPLLVYAGSHHNYLPSVVPLGGGNLLASWLDFDRGPLAAELKFALAK